LLWAWAVRAGLFSVFILGCLLTYIGVALTKRFSFERFFLGPVDDPAGLIPYEELCEKLAEVRKHLTKVGEYLLGTQFEHGPIRMVYVMAVWLTLAFVFNIIGRFWFFAVLLNALLIAPGLTLHWRKKQKLD
jgi:hypothetical protein